MRKGKTRWLWILVAVYIAFIFSNSIANGQTSGELSGSISEAIYSLLQKWGLKLNPDVLHHVIRKLAHFTEYAGLGVLIRVTTGRSVSSGAWLLRLVFLISVPLVDETIQLFVPGRGGSFWDCLIDMAGYLTGFLLSALIARLFAKRKRDSNPGGRDALVLKNIRERKDTSTLEIRGTYYK